MRALAGLLCGLLGLVPGAAAYEPDVFGTAGQVAGQAYYDALAAQRSLAASRQVAELAAQNLEAADAKYRAGAAALSDRLQAQTALSQASLAQVRDEGALSNALGVIALRMGLAPDTPLRLSGELEAQPDTGFVKAIDEMLAEARREHPALLAAQARLKAAASVEESRAAGRPSLALSANLARSHSDQAMAFNGDTRERDRSIGLQLNIPLFEGFERTYQVRNALARREASEAELADTEQQVSLEVWNNYQSLSVETRSLARTRELVEQSRQSLEVVQGRYRSGVGSMIELLNALTAYASAEDQHIRALGNWQTSRLRLAASLGRLGLQMI
ncbi:TolC family protein [Pseudomonas aeruginosa]|uniref:TolC family protein n=2 Tax=Pseudomonas aeruginosa TaxID=287 RepID=UPI0026F349DD|nr:TolC family protein [Pseudomonas aeruginosa]